jgi:hypothetical protein
MSSSTIPEEIRRHVREVAGNLCGYCLSPQRLVMSKLEIEHIIPVALGGNDDEMNLWLSSGLCNRYKGSQVDWKDPASRERVALFNPRVDTWSDHFEWSRDGALVFGLSPSGRATVEALKLNNEIAVEVRRNWIVAGWHPPKGAGGD